MFHTRAQWKNQGVHTGPTVMLGVLGALRVCDRSPFERNGTECKTRFSQGLGAAHVAEIGNLKTFCCVRYKEIWTVNIKGHSHH